MLDTGLRPIEVTLSQSVLDKLRVGQARAWLRRVKPDGAREIDLAANDIYVWPTWEYSGPVSDIVVKLVYKSGLVEKTLTSSGQPADDNNKVYQYDNFWQEVITEDNLSPNGIYKPHVVPLQLWVVKAGVVIAEASCPIQYVPNSWDFNAQCSLISQKLIYQRPENPKIKAFYNSSTLGSAGTFSGIIKTQSNGNRLLTVSDPITEWFELEDYWKEVDYDSDHAWANQMWHDTLTLEMTNTPVTGFQTLPPYVAYSNVTLAFTPENGGLGVEIKDVHIGNAQTFTSFSLTDPNSEWVYDPSIDYSGTVTGGYWSARGGYDPGLTSPIFGFAFTPIFTGGGRAMITVLGVNVNNPESPIDATEMVNFATNQGVESGVTLDGSIDITAHNNTDNVNFKFFMTVDGVTSPIVVLSVAWA
jgi:hypothetical protein